MSTDTRDISKESHLERTAKEPRNASLHTVIIRRIDQINDSVRVLRLEIPPGSPPLKFLPGQWVDTYCPDIPKAGGFTITSAPSKAIPSPSPSSSSSGETQTQAGYIELAIQKSPDNPPAHYLWRGSPPSFSPLLGTSLQVRVGGSFVYPPPGVPGPLLRRLVFVAGGVGVNPLVSMLSHVAELQSRPSSSSAAKMEVRFLYSLRDPGPQNRNAEEMLFLERIAALFAREKVRGRLSLFLTPHSTSPSTSTPAPDEESEEENEDKDEETTGTIPCNESEVPFARRRMTPADLAEAVGTPAERRFAAVYVCGVPSMTDAFVDVLTAPAARGGLGMEPHRVLYEKWW